jgi:hypothetical protein
LRLGNQIINLAIDSTESIRVIADEAHFAENYTLEGDIRESQKIKQLTLLQLEISKKYHAVQKQLETEEISIDQYMEGINAIVDNYKATAKEYIVADFLAPSAYFALFQQINSMMIFDIYDKEDNKLFGAVANVWNQAYPESPRAIQLKRLFTNSKVTMRGEQAIEVVEGNSKALYDISLPSLDGKEILLSHVGEGKVTLIDFTTYAMAQAPAHNLLLAELYEKYKSKGFEIYQVSLDRDSHLWKNAGVNLPWICVRDPQSVYSPIARKYNVIDIPVSFIRNKEGEIVNRIDDYSTLDKMIAQYLK